MDHLDLTVAKECRRTGFAFCAISGKTFGKESILTALVLKKPVALSVDSIIIDSMKDKNDNLAYEIHDNADEKVSFCEHVERNTIVAYDWQY